MARIAAISRKKEVAAVAIHFFHPFASLIGLGSLLINIFISPIRVFIGYAIAALLAAPIGVLMGCNASAYALVNPVLSLLGPSLRFPGCRLYWHGSA